ncbi:MAG TPA: WecB/TagA/CpsF family glycosyltransferase, partial [Acidimicrobiales bacterium]|nr:WecB/TagA/CpsF family glycosyltransferase [Acidimicrobiales bacterium]
MGSQPDDPDHRRRFLGTFVDTVERSEFLSRIARGVDDREPLVVLNQNMHSLALCQKDPALPPKFERADLVFVDGAVVVALARALGQPVQLVHRHAVLDWFWPLLDMAADSGWRVLHIGSHAAVIAEAERQIKGRQPKV